MRRVMRQIAKKVIPLKSDLKTTKSIIKVSQTGNGEPLGRNETYSSVSAMENGIESVKKNAIDAEVINLSD